jgi:hypothetical protein
MMRAAAASPRLAVSRPSSESCDSASSSAMVRAALAESPLVRWAFAAEESDSRQAAARTGAARRIEAPE